MIKQLNRDFEGQWHEVLRNYTAVTFAFRLLWEGIEVFP